MKSINLFEKFSNELESNFKEYSKYNNKFIIIEYEDNLYLAKLVAISLNYIEINNYEWQPSKNEWHEERIGGISLNSINILSSYDTFEEAEKEYKIRLDSNKYNI